jgi:uncharacterized Zn finger protein (UPF0148 family)
MDKLSCPSCGGTTLEMQEGGRVLCAACGAVFQLTPAQVQSLRPCARCGFRSLPGATSCSKCGAPLVKYCPRCGAPLEVGMRFCDQCGASYEASSSPDGLCKWCGSQSAPEATHCQQCGARLIATCPTCGAETKAGSEFCKACGFAYETLLGDREEPSPSRRRWPWSRRSAQTDTLDLDEPAE